MTTIARSAIALTATGTFAVSAAFLAASPSVVAQPLTIPSVAMGIEGVALTAFTPIADQINILVTYGSQAVNVTGAWVSDVVSPLVQGQFWPLSGLPGNYISSVINSTVNLASGLAETAAGFVQAEIDYFGNLVPNVINFVSNAVQNIINWITGLIPWPFAAKAAAAAGRTTAPRRAAATAVASPTAVVASASARRSAVPASPETRQAKHSAPGTPAAATARNAVRGAKSAAARASR